MKRVLYPLIIIAVALLIGCSDDKPKPVKFTDSAFERYCLRHHDTNGDGKFTVDEAEKVEKLMLNSLSINSLDGLEHFVALRELHCKITHITTIELTNQPLLEVLDVGFTLIKELDVSHNPLLRELYCAADINQGRLVRLNSIELTNNPQLEILQCAYNNFSELNLAHNPKLRILGANNNSLTALDLTAQVELEELECSHNKIESLTLGSKPKLERMDVGHNQVGKLNIGQAPQLNFISLNGNPIESIDFSHNPLLSNINVVDCGLSQIELSHCPELWSLRCMKNRLSGLDISSNTKLRMMWCEHNLLGEEATEPFEIVVWRGFELNKVDYFITPPHTVYLGAEG